MLKPEQVPDEAWEAALKCPGNGMREAIAAAINAWPESKVVTEYFLCDSDHFLPALILPLPQDAGDE